MWAWPAEVWGAWPARQRRDVRLDELDGRLAKPLNSGPCHNLRGKEKQLPGQMGQIGEVTLRVERNNRKLLVIFN